MIKLIFLLTYNLFRYAWRRLCYGNRYAAHPLQRISPFCALKQFGNGRLAIGRNTELAHGCDIEAHGDGIVTIGEGTYMNRYCMISAHRSVTIGAHCMFGPGIKIFDNNHRFSKEQGVSPDLKSEAISIGDNCWLGSDVIVLKGARIGNNCVIGAGCVVSGDIPDGTIVKLRQELTIETIRS